MRAALTKKQFMQGLPHGETNAECMSAVPRAERRRESDGRDRGWHRSSRESIIVLVFARYRLGAEALTSEERGDAQHIALMQDIARAHVLRRLEGFQLLSPQADWHRAWIIELPTLEAAEAWVEGEQSLPHGMHAQRTIHLARKWAPEYFASWSQWDATS